MKIDLPPLICDYLCHRALVDRHPAYLHLDRQGTVLAAGGDLANYRVEPLQTGAPVSTVFDFMEGLLPLEDDACHLECLQPQAGACIDAHIIPESGGYWLLLLDTSEEEQRRQAMQQKANELALLREAQARQLSGGNASTANVERLALPFEAAGERKDLAVLAVGLRGAAAAASTAAPAVYLEQLFLLRRRLAAHFQARAGVLYRQTGDLLMVFFGLLTAATAKEEQALKALMPILQDEWGAAPEKQLGAGTRLRPALGLASGPAIVGLDQTPGAAGLQAVGAPLQAADLLQQRAQPGELLIDQTIFEKAGALQDRFDALPADSVPGTGRVYTYRKKTLT
ncbi:MAG: hypothetical protein QNJ61_08635 [Desulfobacterales bacterium]|nr:hypothetical protein [Desulfobacterales bacterium]